MIYVILSFADEETQDIYNGVSSKKARKRLSPVLWEKAQTKLDMLDHAITLDDLRIPPSNRLEKLHGNLIGRYSIRINDQWRIVFKWEGEKQGASSVTIIDYH
jgi:toxin HigB-1